MAARRNSYIVMAAMMGCFVAAKAQAHPHVWIEMQSDVVFTDDGLIKGVDLEWTFDDAYTQMALDGLDARWRWHSTARPNWLPSPRKTSRH